MAKWGRLLRVAAAACAVFAQVSEARTFSERYYKNISVGIDGGGKVRAVSPAGRDIGFFLPRKGKGWKF